MQLFGDTSQPTTKLIGVKDVSGVKTAQIRADSSNNVILELDNDGSGELIVYPSGGIAFDATATKHVTSLLISTDGASTS
ncbi:MAG: hypothetical protein ACPG77_12665, partial [Nannocystaceae bacterium]